VQVQVLAQAPAADLQEKALAPAGKRSGRIVSEQCNCGCEQSFMYEEVIRMDMDDAVRVITNWLPQEQGANAALLIAACTNKVLLVFLRKNSPRQQGVCSKRQRVRLQNGETNPNSPLIVVFQFSFFFPPLIYNELRRTVRAKRPPSVWGNPFWK